MERITQEDARIGGKAGTGTPFQPHEPVDGRRRLSDLSRPVKITNKSELPL
jgi:hypothetical protein